MTIHDFSRVVNDITCEVHFLTRYTKGIIITVCNVTCVERFMNEIVSRLCSLSSLIFRGNHITQSEREISDILIKKHTHLDSNKQYSLKGVNSLDPNPFYPFNRNSTLCNQFISQMTKHLRCMLMGSSSRPEYQYIPQFSVDYTRY